MAFTQYEVSLCSAFPYRGLVPLGTAQEIMALLVTSTEDGFIPEGSSFAVITGNPAREGDGLAGHRVMWLSETSRQRVAADGRWPDVGWEPGISEIVRNLPDEQREKAMRMMMGEDPELPGVEDAGD